MRKVAPSDGAARGLSAASLLRGLPESEVFVLLAVHLPLGARRLVALSAEVQQSVHHHAAQSCFGQDQWPETEPVPQAWIEFEVRDIRKSATS